MKMDMRMYIVPLVVFHMWGLCHYRLPEGD
jgi:hypothetical protein